VLRFLLSPVELLGNESGAVTEVRFVRNELHADPDGSLRARATTEHETIPAGLVFRAIGYWGVALPGVPFDERRGVIPSEHGRVLDPEADNAPRLGEYVVGWIKRGPSGVIGTNKKDAQHTGQLDPRGPRRRAPLGPASPDPHELDDTLRARQPELITYDGWTAIDRHERALGEPSGRPRVKLTTIEELLRAAADD